MTYLGSWALAALLARPQRVASVRTPKITQ